MGHTKIHNGWGETMRVGFIGVGAMGSRMAGRLLAAHHEVGGYDRTRESTLPLQQRGAKGAATSSERSEEHTSELQSPCNLVCRLLLEKKNYTFASLVQFG